MKLMKKMTIALAGLMAAGAVAATAPVAKKKVIQKKPISRRAVTTKREAKEDNLTLRQSSATSAATATTSMPSLTAGTSAADAPAAMKKKTFVDNIRAGVLLEYYGASIADPLSGQQTDKSTGFSQSESTPQELDTRITLGYALNDNLTLSYNAYFFSYSDALDGSTGEDFGFRPADSFLRLNIGKIAQVGKFKWNGDLRFYPGLGSAGTRVPLYIRTGQNFMYSLTPRLTLAAYNTLRYYYRTETAYAPDRDTKGNVYDLRTTLGPAIEYQAFDSAGFSLSFNMDFARTHSSNRITETRNLRNDSFGAYFELGSSLDLTKQINLNPYVDMFTHTMNIEAMQLGANLNFTIL